MRVFAPDVTLFYNDEMLILMSRTRTCALNRIKLNENGECSFVQLNNNPIPHNAVLLPHHFALLFVSHTMFSVNELLVIKWQ